jgi:hypothetical protein
MLTALDIIFRAWGITMLLILIGGGFKYILEAIIEK